MERDQKSRSNNSSVEEGQLSEDFSAKVDPSSRLSKHRDERESKYSLQRSKPDK